MVSLIVDSTLDCVVFGYSNVLSRFENLLATPKDCTISCRVVVDLGEAELGLFVICPPKRYSLISLPLGVDLDPSKPFPFYFQFISVRSKQKHRKIATSDDEVPRHSKEVIDRFTRKAPWITSNHICQLSHVRSIKGTLRLAV